MPFPFVVLAGGEDGRATGWSSADPSRRRHSGPIINAGSLSKQKGPVTNEASVSKDVLVSAFYCILILVLSGALGIYLFSFRMHPKYSWPQHISNINWILRFQANSVFYFHHSMRTCNEISLHL